MTGEGDIIGISGVEADMLLIILLCIEEFPTTKNYPSYNIKSDKET